MRVTSINGYIKVKVAPYLPDEAPNCKLTGYFYFETIRMFVLFVFLLSFCIYFYVVILQYMLEYAPRTIVNICVLVY